MYQHEAERFFPLDEYIRPSDAAEQRRALQQRLRHHSRALNTCAGGALMGGGANSLRTAIPGSPARCGGGALTGGA